MSYLARPAVLDAIDQLVASLEDQRAADPDEAILAYIVTKRLRSHPEQTFAFLKSLSPCAAAALGVCTAAAPPPSSAATTTDAVAVVPFPQLTEPHPLRDARSSSVTSSHSSVTGARGSFPQPPSAAAAAAAGGGSSATMLQVGLGVQSQLYCRMLEASLDAVRSVVLRPTAALRMRSAAVPPPPPPSSQPQQQHFDSNNATSAPIPFHNNKNPRDDGDAVVGPTATHHYHHSPSTTTNSAVATAAAAVVPEWVLTLEKRFANSAPQFSKVHAILLEIHHGIVQLLMAQQQQQGGSSSSGGAAVASSTTVSLRSPLSGPADLNGASQQQQPAAMVPRPPSLAAAALPTAVATAGSTRDPKSSSTLLSSSAPSLIDQDLLKALMHLSNSVAFDEESTLSQIALSAQELLQADRCAVFIAMAATQELYTIIDGVTYCFAYGHGIAGTVAQSHRTVRVASAYEDTRFDVTVDLSTGYVTKHLLCMPVVVDGQLVAVLQVLNRLDGLPFTADDEALLTAFGCVAAARIRMAQAFKEQQRTAIQNEQLTAIARRLAGNEFDQRRLISEIVTSAKSIVGADRCAFYEVVRSSHDVFMRAHFLEGLNGKTIHMPLGSGIAGWVAKHGTSVRIADAYKDARFNRDVDSISGYRTASVLCIPILLNREVIGVFQLINKTTMVNGAVKLTHFTSDDETLLASFASIAAAFWKNCITVRQLRAKKHLVEVILNLTRVVLDSGSTRPAHNPNPATNRSAFSSPQELSGPPPFFTSVAMDEDDEDDRDGTSASAGVVVPVIGLTGPKEPNHPLVSPHQNGAELGDDEEQDDESREHFARRPTQPDSSKPSSSSSGAPPPPPPPPPQQGDIDEEELSDDRKVATAVTDAAMALGHCSLALLFYADSAGNVATHDPDSDELIEIDVEQVTPGPDCSCVVGEAAILKRTVIKDNLLYRNDVCFASLSGVVQAALAVPVVHENAVVAVLLCLKRAKSMASTAELMQKLNTATPGTAAAVDGTSDGDAVLHPVLPNHSLRSNHSTDDGSSPTDGLDDSHFTQEEVEDLQAFTVFVGVAVRNIQLLAISKEECRGWAALANFEASFDIRGTNQQHPQFLPPSAMTSASTASPSPRGGNAGLQVVDWRQRRYSMPLGGGNHGTSPNTSTAAVAFSGAQSTTSFATVDSLEDDLRRAAVAVELDVPALLLEQMRTLNHFDVNQFRGPAPSYSPKLLIPLLVEMFDRPPLNFLSSVLKVTSVTFAAFAIRARDRYRNVPYHNFFHAFDVTQTLYSFLVEGGAALRSLFLPVELCTLLLSAIVHDIDHMGLNNAFHLRAETPMGILTSLTGNTSTLEVHHATLAIQLLTEMRLLANLSQEEQQQAYRLLIDVILATDMAQHNHFMNQVRAEIVPLLPLTGAASAAAPASPPQAGGGSSTAAATTATTPLLPPNKRKLLLTLLLKCADISNVGKPFEVSRRWAISVVEEFYKQGDREREQGLPVTPLFDRSVKKEFAEGQIGFINFVGRPFYELAAQCLPVPLGQLKENLETNEQVWKRALAAAPSSSSSTTAAAGTSN